MGCLLCRLPQCHATFVKKKPNNFYFKDKRLKKWTKINKMPKVLFLKNSNSDDDFLCGTYLPRQMNPTADKEEKREVLRSSRKKLKGDDKRDLC